MSVDDFEPEDPRRINATGRSPADAQSAAPGSRFAARGIDSLIVLVVAVVVAVLLGSGRHLYVIATIFGLLGFVYFVVFESTRGGTPGKHLMGLQVCGPDSMAGPTVKQSAVRNALMLSVVVPYLSGLLGMTAFGVIAFTISRSPTSQGLHDRWAGGTRVVKLSRPEQ